jgi:hypothetical protein
LHPQGIWLKKGFMQISKCLLTVCLAVSVFSVRASDNDAQAKAREALEKKLNDLKGQAPQTVTPPAAPAPAPPPAAVPAPAPVAQPVAAQAPADDASIAKAREAMEKKLNELHGAPPPVTPAAVAAPAAAAAAVAAPTTPPSTVVVPPPQSAGFSPVPAADPESITKAREAMRQKMQSLEGQPAAAPTAPAALPPAAPAVAVTPVEPPTTPGINGPPEADATSINKARESVRNAMASMPAEASSSTNPNALNFPPLSAPPLGISTEKEGHLRALLQQYKMDLISPEQYQAARAKILAGP